MIIDVMDRTLVVDDELDICLMVTNHLRKLHFETDYALTVKDARSKVRTSLYKFIFLDLNLTDGSGLDLIRYMKELNLSAKIIVISALDNESGRALAMGAHLFVNKPFSRKTIDDALRTLNFLPN
jgi:DNA-binding response OmpR family regulator